MVGPRPLDVHRLPLPQHGPDPSWPDFTLVDSVERRAWSNPGKSAVQGASGLTYGGLWDRAERLARGLVALGLQPSEVVVVQLPTIAEFVPVVLAIEMAGGVVCPVLLAFEESRLTEILRIARPRAIITVESHRAVRPAATARRLEAELGFHTIVVGDVADGEMSLQCLAEIGADVALPARPRPESPSELAFTSGTTGRPKGVIHSHATSGAGILSTLTRQGIGESDVVHVALPVGHNFGYFYGVRLALYAGASMVLQERWNPESMAQLAAAHRVTVSLGPPTFLADLREMQERWGGRLDSMRLFTCAGAKLGEDLARWAVSEFPARISKAFGMTEIGHACATGPESGMEAVIHSEGAPQPEMELVILDPVGSPAPPGATGAIAFRGPFLMHGYVDEGQDAFTDDGLFLTGDLGHMTQDGHLVVSGREKNLVIRGGENIPVESVEVAARAVNGVHDAAIVGVPDERLGERPVICVVAEPGSPEPTLQTVIEGLRGMGIPVLHLPEALIFLGEIPLTETGKVARVELRDLAAAKVEFRGGKNG